MTTSYLFLPRKTLQTFKNLWSHLPSHPKFDLDSLSVSYSDVVNELSNLNVHKVCGPDQICTRLLKEGAEQLLSPSLVRRIWQKKNYWTSMCMPSCLAPWPSAPLAVPQYNCDSSTPFPCMLRCT